MRQFTQTNIDPGNCWQTGIACILEVEPETLPHQALIERPNGEKRYYLNALQAYLRTHHRLAYVTVYPHMMQVLEHKAPGWHLLCGPTVRSATNGGRHHCVVARYGEPVWDVHPSRAGLIDVASIGLLVPFPKKWESDGIERVCECSSCKDLVR